MEINKALYFYIYILNYIITKREPGVTPRTEKGRGRRPGDGGDDPKGITALMGKLGLRGAQINLRNLKRTHGTSVSHEG